MANKRLSLDSIEQMKQMVAKGVAPEDIAKHYGIAISSVHNYKKRFKEEGLKFPDVRGKRPTGSVSTIKSAVPPVQPAIQNTVTSQTFNVVVNGVTVSVAGEAKNVNISKDGIEVKF